MTEGWVDCPSLGPGWQRREVLRKGGSRTKQSDTYYKSPRGEKIRSRVELIRLFGCSRDLTDFDFKKGIFVDPCAEPSSPSLRPPAGRGHHKVKKNSKRHLPSQTAATPSPKKPPDLQVFDKPPDPECPDQKPLKLDLDLPKEPPADIPTEKQDLPASEHQPEPEPEPEPQNEQHQNHTPPVPAPEKLGDGAPQETNPEETIANVFTGIEQ